MAFFLQSDISLFPVQNPIQIKWQYIEGNCMNYKLILKKLVQQLEKKQIYPFIENKISRNLVIINFNLKLKEKYDIIYRIQLNTITNNISTHIFFKINNGLRFFHSSQLMLNTVKKIMLYNKIGSQTLSSFIIHPINHSIQVQVLSNTIVLDHAQHFVLLLRLIVYQSQQFLSNFSALLLFSSNQIFSHQLYLYLPAQLRPLYFDINEKNKGYLSKLLEAKELLNFTNYDIQPNINRRYKKDSSAMCQIQANKILKCLPSLRKQLQNQEILYIQPNFLNPSTTVAKQISYKSLQKILAYPIEYPTCLEDEIACIFNTMSVTNFEQNKERIISAKGKFKLSVVPITYSFPLSQNVDAIHQHRPNLRETTSSLPIMNNFTRQIFVKSPLNRSQFAKFQKLRWEKQILTRLRGAKNVYFPKYYNSNQSHFPYKDSLLIDYIPSPTLLEFTMMRTNSMSLFTKLNIIVHISNAIRFLEEYKIAHLDLSSVNILVVKDHLIKIIDFGQSYSQETFKKNNGFMKNICDAAQLPFKYKPGRTFPFCPPEIFIRQKDFTNQQDIYSLGVNFFQMIFGQFPLPFSDKLIQKLYKSKSYQQRIFFAPQKLDTYGQIEFTTILFVLIMKMLSAQQQNKRPFPVWCHLLLRKLQAASFF